jgi:hypothetical protein
MATKVDALNIFKFVQTSPGQSLDGSYDVLWQDFLMHVKNPKGFPVDQRKLANDLLGVPSVFDGGTEGSLDGWDNPNNIKLHVANGGKGSKICDRYITSFPHTTYNYDSGYMVLNNNLWDGRTPNVRATKFVINDAVVIKDWGGDVKKSPVYTMQYYWNGGVDPHGKDLVQILVKTATGFTIQLVQGTYTKREQYYYGVRIPNPLTSWGLLQWNTSDLVNGQWVQRDESAIANTLKPQSDWKNPKTGKPYPMNYVHIPFLGLT